MVIITATYRKSVLCVSITESLNIVEDKPGQRDNHEDNEWNGNKQDWCTIDTASMTGASWTNNNVHQNMCSIVNQWSNVLTLLLVHKDWYHIIHWTHTHTHTPIRRCMTNVCRPGRRIRIDVRWRTFSEDCCIWIVGSDLNRPKCCSATTKTIWQ